MAADSYVMATYHIEQLPVEASDQLQIGHSSVHIISSQKITPKDVPRGQDLACCPGRTRDILALVKMHIHTGMTYIFGSHRTSIYLAHHRVLPYAALLSTRNRSPSPQLRDLRFIVNAPRNVL